MHRQEPDGRNAASLTRPPVGADAGKISSLSSVSPTSSSARDLTMRSLSSRSSSSDSPTAGPLHGHPSPLRRRRSPPASSSSTTSTTTHPEKRLASAPMGKRLLSDTQPDELQHIKDSVERLRAQRTHVEQLRQRNARLELSLAERAKENEKLRLALAAMHGVEQENVGLLRSFQLLEERIRSLEAACAARKEDARAAGERLAVAEKDRDRMQLRVDELSVERDHAKKQLGAIQSAHERALDKATRAQSEWQNKLADLQQSQTRVEHQFQDELALLRRENDKLVRETREAEQRVAQLLATTVRQTTMIEDCDRLLSESKRRHEAASASYHDQLQLHAGLREQVKQLEIQLATREHGGATERHALEKTVGELETKVQKLKDKSELYAAALREKENLGERLQQELLVRDRARLHAEEVVKEHRQRETTLLSEISSLKVALSDMTDERHIAQDQLRGLQEQLEKERTDRSRWATARLKLLAEFCDEETKLSSALHQFTSLDLLADDDDNDVDAHGLGELVHEEDDDSDHVHAAVHAASTKMDAMDALLGRARHVPQASTSRTRTPLKSKSIVFG